MRFLPSSSAFRGLSCLALALTLSACGSSTVGGISDMLGGGGGSAGSVNPVTANTFGGVPVEQLRVDQLCPSIIVREGTDTLRTYAGEERNATTVRYQSQILHTVVECIPAAGQVGLSIGVAGRSLIGPQGAPAALQLPLRVVILNTVTNEVLSSTVLQTQAIIEPGQTSAVFTLVNRELLIPFPQRQSDYQVIVGFDEQGFAG
jgi:hypothetical protein